VTAPETYPDDLRYHHEHDWVRVEADIATFGITWYGQDALGELVHFEPPELGQRVAKDSAYGEVESVKAVTDLIAPLSGEVVEINEKVVDAPETVNQDPYGDGWLVRVRYSDEGEVGSLLDDRSYRSHLATLT
jgi:glycine cleavage system H protein